MSKTNYYLSLDSGGTKVAAVLYNEDFKRCGAVVTGSVRPNTTSAELIAKHTEEIIKGLDLAGKTIEKITGTCEGSVINEIRKVATVKSTNLTGELDLGLSAAGVFGDGILALCGTGAIILARRNGKTVSTGGYGAAVSDEGSGYYIGRCGFIAAIRDREGRGEHTILTDMLARHLGYDGAKFLDRAIFSIYRKTDISPAASVASFAPKVIAAAEQNDTVAINIVKESGRLLGEQACFLIRDNDFTDSMPIALSGSMWRRNRIFYNEFKSVMSEQCAERKIFIPRLEPVLGAMAYDIFTGKDSFTEEDIDGIIKEFPEFEYNINENKRK